MAPTTFLLVRHGETDWNRERRWQGHSDTALNEEGRAQARSLAREIASEPIGAVYSSDLVRAHETARILAKPHGLDVTAVPGLREVNVGSWEGLTRDEIEHRFGDHDGSWQGGETRELMAARVLEALRRIAETHPGGRVLVVTHGGSLRAVLRHARHSALEQPIRNCAVYRIAVEDGAFRETA